MKIGAITQVSGPVVDVEFESGHLPRIREALSVELNGQARVMEVAQHMGGNIVRCIMLAGSEGLARGMKVSAPGKTIEVPVGEATLGRMFNVLGQPIDGGEPVPAEVPRRSIYREPPSFEEQSPAVEILETGIKVIDLLEPYPKGGKIGLFGGAGVGKTVLIQELIYKIPFPKKKLWKWLTYVKYVLLAVFVVIMPVTMVNELGMSSPAFCEYICPAGTLEGGIPLLSTHPELRATLGALFSVKACILIITLIGCLSVCRFFCKVMCPLGAIYGLLNKVSIYHMECNKKTCVSCGKCHNICPMDVDPVKNPNSAECIRCGKCVASCPKESLALKFVYGKKG